MEASELITLRLGVLRDEYVRLCTDIRSIESNNEKILTVGVVLLTGGAVYGAANKVDQFFLFLPIAATIVLMYVNLVYFWVYSLAGYKRHIEDLINKLLGERMLTWEIIAPERTKLNLSGIMLLSLYGVVWFLIAGYSIYRVWSVYASGFTVAVGVVCGMLFVILLVALHGTFSVREATYLRAKAIHAEP